MSDTTYRPPTTITTSVHRATTVEVVTRRTVAPVGDPQFPEGLFATVIKIALDAGGSMQLTVYGTDRSTSPTVTLIADDWAPDEEAASDE